MAAVACIDLNLDSLFQNLTFLRRHVIQLFGQIQEEGITLFEKVMETEQLGNPLENLPADRRGEMANLFADFDRNHRRSLYLLRGIERRREEVINTWNAIDALVTLIGNQAQRTALPAVPPELPVALWNAVLPDPPGIVLPVQETPRQREANRIRESIRTLLAGDGGVPPFNFPLIDVCVQRVNSLRAQRGRIRNHYAQIEVQAAGEAAGGPVPVQVAPVAGDRVLVAE